MSISRKIAEGAGSDGGSGGGYVDDVFSTYLYTGDGTQYRAIENGIDLAGEGGLVWIKNRDVTNSHYLQDTERGAVQTLSSNTSDPSLASEYLSAFGSDGFTISQYPGANQPGEDYVSWTFRKAPSFFDVVTYTGNATAGRTVSHNLGSVPGMIIVKRTDGLGDWYVYHSGTGNDKISYLNDTAASATNVSWNNTDPTSTDFTVSNASTTNGANREYVAYLFANDDSDESMIKCGSVTTNDSGQAEMDLGWEPQWILYKETDRAGPWRMMDSMRGMPNNGITYTSPTTLMAHESSAEAAYDVAWATSTGFYLHNGAAAANYIYMAIRRPNKPAEEFEPEELFAIDTAGSAGDGSVPAFRSGFPVDMGLERYNVNATGSTTVMSRLTGSKTLYTDLTDVEGSRGDGFFDYQNGYYNDTDVNSNWPAWMWRRAPGHFDTVCYEGNGQAGREVPHNLGVAPEMMWIKPRSDNDNWGVYSKSINITERLFLNSPGPATAPADSPWNNTAPTDTVFTVGPDDPANKSPKDYIAYLFASVPGISKVGSYTGTGVGGDGSSMDIDCGFTNGARWVLVKRTDAASDWIMTTGSIGNAPLAMTISLNTTRQEVGGYGLSTIPSGFNVIEGDFNTAGATYIFYAIA